MKNSTFEWIYKRLRILAVFTGLILAGLFSAVIKKILNSLDLTEVIKNELWLTVTFFGIIIIVIVFSIGLFLLSELISMMNERKTSPENFKRVKESEKKEK